MNRINGISNLQTSTEKSRVGTLLRSEPLIWKMISSEVTPFEKVSPLAAKMISEENRRTTHRGFPELRDRPLKLFKFIDLKSENPAETILNDAKSNEFLLLSKQIVQAAKWQASRPEETSSNFDFDFDFELWTKN